MERKAVVLRVACVPSIAAALLPPVLSRFMKQHPNVICHIETCSHAGIIDRLIRRQSDIGFALASTPSAVIVEEALVSGSGVCVAPRARREEGRHLERPVAPPAPPAAFARPGGASRLRS